MRPHLDEPPTLGVQRDRGVGGDQGVRRDQASLALGLVGIVTFAASLLSVTWLPTRLDVLLALAIAGLLCLFAALAIGRE